MCQLQSAYHQSQSLTLLGPWMLARLPKVVDPTARAHIIQLAACIFESHSALVATIVLQREIAQVCLRGWLCR